MVELAQELKSFTYREMEVPLSDIFPNVDIVELRDQFAHYKDADPHRTVYNVARALWYPGGYLEVIKACGFWDAKYPEFTGNAHQCTPILGAVLKALGFEVSFLEGFKIRNHFFNTGSIDQVPPSEEQNPNNKAEFVSLRRIPYCCLEVEIKGKMYYVSPKHIKPDGEGSRALLTPSCYQDFIGVFRHQNDATKSGIYLQPIIPKYNLEKANYKRRIVWAKQTINDSEIELFATYLRMQLTI